MPRRIVSESPASTEGQSSTKDHRGIGCGLEYISFSFPDGSSYVCSQEKVLADDVLNRNQQLWPAIVVFPTGLTPDLLYAQCTFKYASYHDFNYKEASGVNNFFREGNLVEFMREYDVKSLLVAPKALADVFARMSEPRVKRCLFLIRSDGSGVSYQTGVP